ncbi:HPr family phosphocarrier protein [Bacillus marinisedimentorum]|uniref:HPr family phosphocarrier protein n=1 Tax=Bacillus marinisedimentorum TaxID=1821260 RepID=UPI000872D71B|nr:HPr family phosphocarrier protein [Bacillus marinisedimentorum]
MSESIRENVPVQISDELTIVDLSALTQKYKSEIYLKKVVRGSVIEVSLKSFLGLITLQLQNGDEITIRAVGEDSEEAVAEVETFFS